MKGASPATPRAGFAPQGVMTAALSLPAGHYSEERGRLWEALAALRVE